MDEADLQVFIDGVTNYFSQTTNEAAVVGTPYLIENQTSVASEFTGIIGISGRRRGSVCFTAPSQMLTTLLERIGESDRSRENMCDLVGEVANTLSGNARREFGKEFMISVPVVIQGTPERMQASGKVHSFVIPINWSNSDAHLVISLE